MHGVRRILDALRALLVRSTAWTLAYAIYLVRRPAHRELRFTREGKFFIGMTLGIGFAAVNTANNLLYLLLSVMLALVIASGVLSELVLAGITVAPRRAPGEHVYRRGPLDLEVRNGNQIVSSYAIHVQRLDGDGAGEPWFFLEIPAHSCAIVPAVDVEPRDEDAEPPRFRVMTRFPFGLFEKSRVVPLMTGPVGGAG